LPSPIPNNNFSASTDSYLSRPPLSNPPPTSLPTINYQDNNLNSPPLGLPPTFSESDQYGDYNGEYENENYDDNNDFPTDMPPSLPPDFQYEEPEFQLTEQELKMLNFASREVKFNSFNNIIASSHQIFQKI
jgi:hypothetical protein